MADDSDDSSRKDSSLIPAGKEQVSGPPARRDDIITPPRGWEPPNNWNRPRKPTLADKSVSTLEPVEATARLFMLFGSPLDRMMEGDPSRSGFAQRVGSKKDDPQAKARELLGKVDALLKRDPQLLIMPQDPLATSFNLTGSRGTLLHRIARTESNDAKTTNEALQRVIAHQREKHPDQVDALLMARGMEGHTVLKEILDGGASFRPDVVAEFLEDERITDKEKAALILAPGTFNRILLHDFFLHSDCKLGQHKEALSRCMKQVQELAVIATGEAPGEVWFTPDSDGIVPAMVAVRNQEFRKVFPEEAKFLAEMIWKRGLFEKFCEDIHCGQETERYMLEVATHMSQVPVQKATGRNLDDKVRYYGLDDLNEQKQHGPGNPIIELTKNKRDEEVVVLKWQGDPKLTNIVRFEVGACDDKTIEIGKERHQVDCRYTEKNTQGDEKDWNTLELNISLAGLFLLEKATAEQGRVAARHTTSHGFRQM